MVGLIVSLIMKYADNMVKIFAVAVSMSLTMFVSIILFDFIPTINYLFGIIIITISILLYFGVVSEDKIILTTEAPSRPASPRGVSVSSSPRSQGSSSVSIDVNKL